MNGLVGGAELGSWWTSVAASMSSSQRRRHLYVNISFLFESTPSKHTNISFYCPHPSHKPPWKKKIQYKASLDSSFPQTSTSSISGMHHTSHIFQSHTSGDNFHGSIYPQWIDLCLESWDLRENPFSPVQTSCVSQSVWIMEACVNDLTPINNGFLCRDTIVPHTPRS